MSSVRLGWLLTFLLFLGCPSRLAHAQQFPPSTLASGTLTDQYSTPCTPSSCVTLYLGGYTGVAIQISGTWMGTVSFYCSATGAAETDYVATSFSPVSTGSAGLVSSTTTNGYWQASVNAQSCQVRFTTDTSGSVVVSMRAAPMISSTGAGTTLTDPTSGAPLTIIGACTPDSTISTASVLEAEISATAAVLSGLWISSIDATPVYGKLYNGAAADIDETDTPVWRLGIPANSTAALGVATVNLMPAVGMNFTTAITIRVTTGIADNDTGALSANEVLVSWCAGT